MHSRLIASLLALGAIAAGSAVHADTATINTNATILSTCKFRSVPMALAFPDIDPGSDEAVVQDIQVAFSCTRDTAVKFAVNDKETGVIDGALGNGSATVTYSISWGAPTNLTAGGLAKGHSQANWATVKLTGTIAKEAFQDAAAGAYSDPTGLKLSVNP